MCYEAVVWVNEEGSMTTKRDTEEEAKEAVTEMAKQAEAAGWLVKGTEVNFLEELC